MKAVLSFCVLLFLASFALANHVVPPGTYRQCDFVTGDETILQVGAPTSSDPPIYPTSLTFNFDGCRTDDVAYTATAQYDWVFATSKRSDNNGTNTEYQYSSARATPNTQDALEALRRTCPNRSFSVGQSTDVLGCLFCNPRFDLYIEVQEGQFALGDSIACSEAERPSQFEESVFVLTAASPSGQVSPTVQVSQVVGASASNTRTPGSGTPRASRSPVNNAGPDASRTPARTPTPIRQTPRRSNSNLPMTRTPNAGRSNVFVPVPVPIPVLNPVPVPIPVPVPVPVSGTTNSITFSVTTANDDDDDDDNNDDDDGSSDGVLLGASLVLMALLVLA